MFDLTFWIYSKIRIVKLRSELAGFLDRIDEINSMGGSRKVGLRKAKVLRSFGDALKLLRELCVLCGYFVSVFHQFCFLFDVLPVF